MSDGDSMEEPQKGEWQKEEWLTVAESADRLGLNVRQARRYADRLRGTKDRTGEDVSPARVLLSALRSQMAKAGTGTASEGQRTGQGQDKDTEGQGQGQGVSFAVEHELRVQIEQQQGEIAFLRQSLSREQENTRGALARLEDAEKRATVLIAAAAQGRLTAAGLTSAEDVPIHTEGKASVGGPKQPFWRRFWRRD